MKSTKTPDNLNEERLFLSDELRSRLDESLLSEESNNNSFDEITSLEEIGTGYDLEISVYSKKEKIAKKYDVVGWSPNTLLIAVPPEQLSQFHLHGKDLTFTIYDTSYLITETHGDKKDGEWVVSLLYEDI
tara:strand:- start:1789 stop:2181 length:393 start_codon:yes stop_codon:yes gene_type:complete